MKIDQKTFRVLLKSEQVPFWTATSIIARSYCGPMTGKGLCPSNCALCQPKLQETLDLKDATNPSALLTWKLRNLIAVKQEERQIEEHPPIDEHPLGFQIDDVNVFEAMLRDAV